MISPKGALEDIARAEGLFTHRIREGHLGGAISVRELAKAAIPVAELHEEIVDLMGDTPVTQEETVDWVDKRDVLLARLEALK